MMVTGRNTKQWSLPSDAFKLMFFAPNHFCLALICKKAQHTLYITLVSTIRVKRNLFPLRGFFRRLPRSSKHFLSRNTSVTSA
jgi:hypothetical protein